MPVGRIVAILLILLFAPLAAIAQYQPPSTYLHINSDRASTWSEGSTTVIQLQGPITIDTDRAHLTADRAVIWLTPLSGAVADQQRVEIALFGNASLALAEVSRTGDALFVATEVRGVVRLTANQRSSQNLSESDLYRDGSAMRPLENIPPSQLPSRNAWALQRPWLFAPPPAPATAPTTQYFHPKQRVSISFPGNLKIFPTPEQKIAVEVTGGITILISRANGDILQLQSDRAVLFTSMSSVTDAAGSGNVRNIQDAITAAYLEGDVRIIQTYAEKNAGEQRLRARRVFYDLAQDRAVLTDAVVHTIDPKSDTPLVVRAQLVRQLSYGEFTAEGARLSVSTFKTPSYELYSQRAYVRQYDSGDPRLGQRTDFEATNNVTKIQGVPVFYWPWAAGSMTEKGMPLRSILFGSARGFGPGVRTNWGLFESVGQPPPQDLDASYRLDYFGDRGPAAGLDAKYSGGFITDTSKQPWGFDGSLQSYFVNDHGEDRLSRERFVEPDENFRYHFLWQHQQFIPGDWQLQLRAGMVSDPTFLEEYFNQEFFDGPPHDLSAYIKRQHDTEALTLLGTVQPSGFVTTADMLQEGFEVERLPELGYYRIGDSFGENGPSFFSANTLSALDFEKSSASLADLGFRNGANPGQASLGTTGLTDDMVYRGDFREEVDFPGTSGHFRTVPYVFGRYTAYSSSPVAGEGSVDRIFAGAGVRMTTSFWKIDDTASSDLFDVHRVRHVVEPELNLFTSGQTTDRNSLFVFDEPVDAVNDVSAAQIAINQRWQTKRGGPGRWRNVDFFNLRVEGNFFANQPENTQINPITSQTEATSRVFRGLYFPSMPEASIPRNGVNADALWRLTDTTAVLSDAEYNLDRMTLATTSLGIAAQRGARMSYFVGGRYIGELNSMIASFSSDYDLTSKYTIRFAESFSLTDHSSQASSATIIRRFDRYFATFTIYYDAVQDSGGFRFGIFPEGLGSGISSDQVQRAASTY